MSWDDPDDWETMQALEPRAGEQLERTLERYTRVRLDPSPAQAKRARAAVMEAAWRTRIAPEAASRRWHLPFSGWSARRVGLAATAAVFAGLLVGSSTFAASRAGGPLYGARIAVEDALLPSDPAARVQAQIANAQVRLAEAYDAEARRDEGAMAAALAAYETDATTLSAVTGPDASMALAAVEQHRDILKALIAKAPATALPGLNQALESSDKAIQVLTDTDKGHGGSGSGGNGTSGGSGSGTGGNGSSGGNNGSNSGNGNSATPPPAPTPAPTVKPDHTPKPKPTVAPGPDVTPKPDHTPKPRPSSAPGGKPTPSPSL
jgi:uncharacterized membrane protein YgcG